MTSPDFCTDHAVPAILDTSPCDAPWWLPGSNVQTIYGAFFARTHRLRFIRQRVDTPDGDFLDFDWSAPGMVANPMGKDARSLPNDYEPISGSGAASRWLSEQDQQLLLQTPEDTPGLVLLHGLEGSSASRYAQSITQHFRARGWIVVIAHFRGCSGAPNRLARAYYSGDAEEVRFILSTVRAQAPGVRWHAVGVSLGGNALLKSLGEAPEQQSWLAAAAGISVPLDLVACGKHLSQNKFNRWVYTRHFLNTLKPKVMDKARLFPGAIDVVRVSHARDLQEFDDAYTAPMHGFRDALDYWAQSSSKPWLRHIQTPTLVLNARNDPFIPEPSLPGPDQASAAVVLHQPAQGGHAGFVTGGFPGHLNWLPHRLARFFEHSSSLRVQAQAAT